MCKRFVFSISFVLLLYLVGSASAGVLYSDTFNRPDSPTIGNNDNGMGGFITVPWVDDAGTTHQISDNALITLGDASSYIDHKFTRTELLTPFTIEFDIVPGVVTGDNWLAIEFAPTPDSFTTSVDINKQRITFGVLFRPQGGLSVWDNGTRIVYESGLIVPNMEDPVPVKFQIDSPEGYNHGNTATVQLWVNGILYENIDGAGGSSCDITWQDHADGLYISLESHGNPKKGIDNLVISSPFKQKKAFAPHPAHQIADVPRDVILSWTPGELANTHDVYFGANLDDVNNATITMDLTGVYQGRQDVSSYAVGETLDFGQTYYWRIDEVNAAPDYTVFKGDVWSFRTELFAYVIENVTATASSSEEGKEAENTVNGSGLDPNGLFHDNIGEGNMWLSARDANQPTWIEFEFQSVQKVYEMWVWNSNESLERDIGLGFKDVTIEYSVDNIEYTTLGTTHEFTQALGQADYAHDTTIDMEGVPAKYVKLTANSNWGDILEKFGLSEVRFFSIPVQAREPNPAAGAVGVDLDLTLGFRAGRQADKHDVYFSEDYLEVVDGTAPVTTVTETSYGPLALDLGKTYFWRIDEVNDVEAPSVWKGDIWHFTTHEYFVLDDFESYDSAENQIWYTWKDGLGYGTLEAPPYYSGNSTGAAIGDETTDSFTEETIVHSGKQSMPLAYNNNKEGHLNYSEATMTLSSHRDWTARGVKELSLWFRGNPPSVGSFIEGPVGTYTMTASGVDIWDTSDEFHYAFKTLTGPGSITAKVESLENTHGFAKAGLMVRDTLLPDSTNAALLLTPENGVRFQFRQSTGGTTDRDFVLDLVAPLWLKLERDVAGIFRGYYSSDGVNFQALTLRPNVSIGSEVYIGLAVTSHDAALTCQAVFSDVQTTGIVAGQWQSQDIGISSNVAEPLYVAVSNNAGAPAVVYHDNPAAATIDTWTEWIIDLNQLADQGVNLTDVDNISIGLGDKNDPHIGGSGILYIDDIRLYGSRAATEE